MGDSVAPLQDGKSCHPGLDCVDNGTALTAKIVAPGGLKTARFPQNPMHIRHSAAPVAEKATEFNTRDTRAGHSKSLARGWPVISFRY
jgi:hypothetical protein